MTFLARATVSCGFVVFASVLAAAAPRSLQGTVRAEDGMPLAGAVVKIKNMGDLRIRSYVTPKNGSYRFQALFDDADYQVWAEYQGTASSRKTLSRFDSREDAVIDLVVRVPSSNSSGGQ